MSSFTFIFTTAPYQKSDVPLASLIPDKRYPNQDALTKIVLKEGEDYSITIDKNFDGRIHLESNSFFKTAVTSIFSTEWGKESENSFHVTAEEGRIYALRQPKAIFKKLCEIEEVQKWLQEGYIDKQKTYFVIGYRTLLNAKLVHQDKRSTKVEGKVKIPVGAAVGLDPTLTGYMDPQVAIGHQQGTHNETKFQTIGERIYAICYRKVGFKFSKVGNGAFLDSENSWKSFSKTRGSRAPEENEVVKAYIEEQDEDGIGQVETFATADGKERFIYLSQADEDSDDDE
jgi:hypothetical protein